ncbi:hypothetical protein GGX14DRAFT_534816 [Mycena pura]|uniref:Fatty acid desaturase domain-containing protein n=1 Tax=Mycena pura TaxID=153505 RepID=A0AAD6VEV5_9AGAR|nr:hypothetical protein GGX14DRAFT_534816 [Mycena pura]
MLSIDFWDPGDWARGMTPVTCRGNITAHFSPSSVLFKKSDYNKIIASNIGLVAIGSVLVRYSMNNGAASLLMHYVVPSQLCHHWIVLITYLQHSDPTLPHYRAGKWTWLRGALATVDRPILGWVGRVFLHNVSHDHTGHHIFPSVPFYNQPVVTETLKTVLGADYNYDSTGTFYALYRTFTQCYFVDDEGDVVMYRNRYGQSARVIAPEQSSE